MPETVVNTGVGDSSSLMMLIGRMDAKLDVLLTSDKEQDRRLDILEKWQARAMGIWAAVSAAAGVCGTYIINHIWH